MARIDSSLPPSRWRTGQRIRPSAWSGADLQRAPTVLRTLNQYGDVTQDVFPPPWSLHLGVPETLGKPNVRMLANGFELHYPGLAEPACVRCLMTGDGLWTGQANIELHPNLFSPELEVREQEETALIERDGRASALTVRREDGQTRFCLCVDADSADTATRLAQAGVPTDLDQRWERETQLRKRFWNDLAEFDLPVDVLSTALETLVYHLEPTENGGLRSSTAWPILTDSNANALFPLIQSWITIDPDVADALLEHELSRIQDDGSLSAEPSPATMEPGAPAWPMLVQSCLLYQNTIPKSNLVIRSLPLLEKYLTRSLHTFDPDHRGLPNWSSAAASFIPESYDDGVASVSLAALLLREIDAFLTLTDSHPADEESTALIESVGERLLANLATDLWDEGIGSCLDRYIDGPAIARVTLSSLMPLGVARLPELLRTSLLRTIGNPNMLGGGAGLALWQPWESDENAPPACSAHQVFALIALETSGTVAENLEEQCADAIVRWFTAHGALPIELRTGAIEAADPASPSWYESSLMAACLTLRTLPAIARRKVEDQAPAYLQALDRHRFTILFALGLIIVGVVAASILGDRRRPIELKEETVSTQLFRNLMSQGDYVGARSQLSELKRAAIPPPEVPFLEANLLFRENRFPEAITLYEQCVEDDISIPRADMNLALAYFHAERLNDAIAQYEAVIDEFGEDNPTLEKLAKTAIRIIKTYGTNLLAIDEELPSEE